jgi:pantetheine-phosphate adenylyltransferase
LRRGVAPDEPAFEHVCMGGTFSPLHRGHRALLSRAVTVGENVFVGVTQGELAQANRDRVVPPAKQRIRAVREALEAGGAGDRAEVDAIQQPEGRALEPRFEAIVVSPETRGTAERINATRRERGLDPLAIEVVPFVLGIDGRPVNGTRVANGEVDPEGVEPKRAHLAVGTANPVKVEAARDAYGRLVPNVEAEAVDVDSGVPEQPRDEEGPQGAARRARRALEAHDAAGIGVGIEAAIVTEDPSGQTHDVQYAALADEQGRVTLGAGPGFAYPPRVLDDLEDGHTVGQAFERLTGREDVGREEGAIGVLTRGATTRRELTEWALLSALVPRLRPAWYTPLALDP